MEQGKTVFLSFYHKLIEEERKIIYSDLNRFWIERLLRKVYSDEKVKDRPGYIQWCIDQAKACREIPLSGYAKVSICRHNNGLIERETYRIKHWNLEYSSEASTRYIDQVCLVIYLGEKVGESPDAPATCIQHHDPDEEYVQQSPANRPAKIYLRPMDMRREGMAQCTVSFGTPSGTHQVEYVDISKLWHDRLSIPSERDRQIILQFYEGTIGIFGSAGDVFNAFATWSAFIESFRVERWAYTSDLFDRDYKLSRGIFIPKKSTEDGTTK